MKELSLQNINGFLNCKTIAIAGASRNERSFSAAVILHLRKMNYNIQLINPNFDDSNNDKNEFISVSNLPENVNNLLVLTSPSQTTAVVKHAIEKGIRNIWIQQKSETAEAIALCHENKINLISKQCIFMLTPPEGFHKFHYYLKKIGGTLPK